MENKKAVKEKQKLTFTQSIFEWVELVAISVAAVIIILNCFARYSPVNGASMNETLQDKDILILSDLFYTPDNGDIVVFATDDTNNTNGTGYDEPYVKRVIATEGQVVDYDPNTGVVTVDGEIPEWEKYAVQKSVEINPDFDPTLPESEENPREIYAYWEYDPQTGTYTKDGKPATFEEYYSVARSGSNPDVVYPYEVPEGHVFVMGDNRWHSHDSRAIGPVDVRTILGKVVFRLYPNTGIVD